MSASSGESAVQLPWLAPGARALAALARPGDAASPAALLADPAALLLVYRFPDDPVAPLRFAREQLRRPPVGVLPTDAAGLLDYCRRLGAEAERLANASDSVDATCARVAATVAPLGQLALAVSGDADDAGSVARRLLRRWNLPEWLSAIVGNLDLPADVAATCGADPALFAVVQAARAAVTLESASGVVDSPYESPLLVPLLDMALDAVSPSSALERLEAENEALRRALLEQRLGEDERLRTRKLTAVAEFAAGAGHEINNPLAVMSGQAQYLLVRETDADRQKALQTVVQQAHRVHAILTDLMQFARPAKPRPQVVDVADVVREAVDSLRDFAAARPVRIDVSATPAFAEIDAKQVRTAIAALVRNGIEAVPADGWVRVTVEAHGEMVRVIVDDSGVGPTAEQREHLFDPFYSGRSAGRGRGLGLPTAWRLAREQGGDATFEPTGDCPARFVLTVPRVEACRLSA